MFELNNRKPVTLIIYTIALGGIKWFFKYIFAYNFVDPNDI